MMEVKPIYKIKKRGGFRTGARRPTLYQSPMKSENIRLADQHRDMLAQISSNIGAAVRAVLDDPIISAEILLFIKRRNNG